MLTGIPADAMVGIDPAGILTYLRASGGREAGSYSQAAIWTQTVDGAEAEVLVPISAELRDYPIRLAELVSTLTTVEQRPTADVLQDLRSPTLDVQYIRMMPDGPSGSTPLHEGYLAIRGVHDLLLAAATSAVSAERPTVLPSQKPPQAKGFQRSDHRAAPHSAADPAPHAQLGAAGRDRSRSLRGIPTLHEPAPLAVHPGR
jgi:hypothetical protein